MNMDFGQMIIGMIIHMMKTVIWNQDYMNEYYQAGLTPESIRMYL